MTNPESELVERVAKILHRAREPMEDWSENVEFFPDQAKGYRETATAAILTVLREMLAYNEELLEAYREKWKNSDYGGPGEILPSTIESLIGPFIKDFAIEHSLSLEDDKE